MSADAPWMPRQRLISLPFLKGLRQDESKSLTALLVGDIFEWPVMAEGVEKADRNRVPVSAFRRSGYFSFPPRFVEAVLGY